MANSSLNITFKKNCTLEKVQDPHNCSDLDGRIIIDNSVKSSEFLPPCPSTRYFVYISKSNAPVEIKGINCTINKITSTNVKTASTIFSGEANTLNSNSSSPMWDPDTVSPPSKQTPTHISSLSMIVPPETNQQNTLDFSSVCSGGSTLNGAIHNSFVYATYFSVKNSDKDLEWDSDEMMRHIFEGIQSATNYCSDIDKNSGKKKGMVAVCQNGCVTTYDFISKSCKCLLCWDCQKCCDKMVQEPLNVPDVTLSNGESKDIYVGGCPPYKVSFKFTKDESILEQVHYGFSGNINYYPVGWKKQSSNGKDTSYQPEKYKKTKAIRLEGSNPICGKITYVVEDACGKTDKGKIDCGCCPPKTYQKDVYNSQCFGGGFPPYDFSAAVNIPLEVHGETPISFHLAKGYGYLSSAQQNPDDYLASSVYQPWMCGEHIITAIDSCGIRTDLHVNCTEKGCCPPEVPTEINNDPASKIFLNTGGSALVFCSGTFADIGADFEWSVVGEGLTFSNGGTHISGKSPQLISSAEGIDFCTGNLLVTDICKNTTFKYIENPNVGSYASMYYDAPTGNFGYWGPIPSEDVFEDVSSLCTTVPVSFIWTTPEDPFSDFPGAFPSSTRIVFYATDSHAGITYLPYPYRGEASLDDMINRNSSIPIYGEKHRMFVGIYMIHMNNYVSPTVTQYTIMDSSLIKPFPRSWYDSYYWGINPQPAFLPYYNFNMFPQMRDTFLNSNFKEDVIKKMMSLGEISKYYAVLDCSLTFFGGGEVHPTWLEIKVVSQEKFGGHHIHTTTSVSLLKMVFISMQRKVCP